MECSPKPDFCEGFKSRIETKLLDLSLDHPNLPGFLFFFFFFFFLLLSYFAKFLHGFGKKTKNAWLHCVMQLDNIMSFWGEKF